MAINNGIGRVWAANAGDEGRPAGVGPVWIENIDAITPSGSGGRTYTGGRGIDVDNTNDIISLDDDTQAAINSYVINSGSFLTDADLSGYATETWVSGQGYMKNLFLAQYGVTSYADVKAAVYNNKIVYCRISSGEYHSGRMAFLAYNQFYSPSDPRNFFEFQYYRSAEGSGTDSVFVYKIFPDNTWTTEERTAACRSDWNATSGKSQIRNKPDLSIYATISGMEEYVTEQTSAFITSADIPPIPEDVVTSAELATVSGNIVSQIPDTSDMATQTWVQNQGYISSIPSEYVTDTEMSEYVTSATSAFVTSADIPEVPVVKDLIAGNGINISATSGDVTISADTSVLATQADLGPYATQTWSTNSFFPIDGLQVVGSSAEASGANIIYIVSGSNS